MAWTPTGNITAPVVDGDVEPLVSGDTATRDAIDARVGAGITGKQPIATLEADVAGFVGDAGALDTALDGKYATYKAAAKNPDLLIAGAVTGDPITSAIVEWPDAKPGVLTITARHATGAVNAYNITHVDGATTVTYTQPTITRAASGVPTNVPQIVVS